MRLKLLGAAVVAVLAAATLSACQTNVGEAAVIDGHRVSESDVSSYLTSSAQPVALSQTTTTPARVFVLDVLILRPYLKKLISASPIGNVSERKLAAAHQEQLNGKSDKSVAAQIGVHGYSTAFDKLVVDLSILLEVRSRLSSAQLAAADKKVSFGVSLNPRYGSWTRKGLFIDSDASAGTPGFLKLQPTAVAGS
ncbi:hypothetical protein [Jatrophihabitans endophyticus]|uniref:hypothetical protein n=1 Tax=Jatrophihabitans endophyticus TaxID=1206085 RepID=UPI001A0BF675|nr:hypothetical protein [Jatrophihabitans endophyticus]MBE7188415.1 hypothetical protein [Jatrophihabitans endophyticus]